ncbi:hypothetical protein HOF17_02420, partial [Candidatus Peribacteria bacterium]|nr:hypothetical protein [Candidatus Peribacteria bacterium]
DRITFTNNLSIGDLIENGHTVTNMKQLEVALNSSEDYPLTLRLLKEHTEFRAAAANILTDATDENTADLAASPIAVRHIAPQNIQSLEIAPKSTPGKILSVAAAVMTSVCALMFSLEGEFGETYRANPFSPKTQKDAEIISNITNAANAVATSGSTNSYIRMLNTLFNHANTMFAAFRRGGNDLAEIQSLTEKVREVAYAEAARLADPEERNNFQSKLTAMLEAKDCTTSVDLDQNFMNFMNTNGPNNLMFRSDECVTLVSSNNMGPSEEERIGILEMEHKMILGAIHNADLESTNNTDVAWLYSYAFRAKNAAKKTESISPTTDKTTSILGAIDLAIEDADRFIEAKDQKRAWRALFAIHYHLNRTTSNKDFGDFDNSASPEETLQILKNRTIEVVEKREEILPEEQYVATRQ